MTTAEMTTAAQGRTVCTTCGSVSVEGTCGACLRAADRSRIAREELRAWKRYPQGDTSYR